MGNHSIDCEFCGEDRRLKDPCCVAYAQHEKAVEEERKAKRERLRREILAIDPDANIDSGYYSDSMRLEDVLKLVRRVVERLKERLA